MTSTCSKEFEAKSIVCMFRPNADFKIEKGIFFGASFTDKAIADAKKQSKVALIVMPEREQADLLAKLQTEEFIGGLNLLEDTAPVCQHSQCFLGSANTPDVLLYFNGIRLRMNNLTVEQLYIGLCNEHYTVFEQKYLKGANWISKFKTN